jgi:dTDP-4-amino-4,6-dideoxygalactose transaminase
VDALRSQPRHHSVPFLDLRDSNEAVQAEVLADVAVLIETGAFTNGPPVTEFERAFAAACGVDHCVGVASGLDALRLALIAAGVGPGAEVIVPAHTFVATFEAVTQAGALPVVADISVTDYGLDPDAAAASVTARTRALMPVHLYGQMADMAALVELASRWGAKIVEDACQAHGATRDGARSGAAGLAGCFSFYPGKNLGAFGDAGAMVTDDPELAATVRALREHGQREKYRHGLAGWTSRLDTIQALVLKRKLPLLEDANGQRKAAAAYYTSTLEGVGDLVLPNVPEGSDPVWHLYVVRSRRRDALAAFLGERGIGIGYHYPEPPHLSGAYASLEYSRGAFPVAEALADECLSLPMFPGISEGQLDAVVSGVEAFFRNG